MVINISAGKPGGILREVIFVIQDSGIGINEKFIKKLFLPFEQDTYQRVNYGGSGLGFAIAGSYAKMMGGFYRR